VIRNGKFVAVGLGAGVALSGSATVIELDDGQTILPGMFDLHAHYNYDLVDHGRVEEVQHSGNVFLANGVTATWSAGEYYPERVLAQRELIDKGEATGPRLFASGPYMGGFRCEYAIKTAADDCVGWPNDITEAEIRAEVDYWADRGVISIKIKQATPDETRILIDQAHRRGLTTAGHLYNYEMKYDVDAREAIRMGLDRLEHNITLGVGGPRSAEADEVIALLLEQRTYFDPNLQMYGGINLRKDLPGMVWTDEAQYFTPYAQKLLEQRGPPPPESEPEDFNQRLVELRKFYGAGGASLLIVGTDEPVYTSLLAGFAYHREPWCTQGLRRRMCSRPPRSTAPGRWAWPTGWALSRPASWQTSTWCGATRWTTSPRRGMSSWWSGTVSFTTRRNCWAGRWATCRCLH
jgi:hypothetical protein